MTSRRAPISIDAALARIAGQLPRAWAEMADVTSRSESLVRAWGDPNRREKIPLDCAIALDLAYRAAGGEGAPLFEAYGNLLDEAGMFRFANEITLGRLAAQSIVESAQAHAALVSVAQPGATDRGRAEARREVEEAIAVLHRALPMLTGTRPALLDEALGGHPSTAPPG